MTPITTIDAYLERLRDAMRDDDPALVQDALYDAEEYLRAELAQHPGRATSDVLGEIVQSYGAPEEVAAAYRATESTVAAALRTPTRPRTGSFTSDLFGVFVDPRTYASMFYMLLALATGVFYFTVVVTGLSMSLGFAITLIGIPLFLLFLAIVRVLSLVEGRVVEAMLGVRMPRRPLHRGPPMGLFQRIVEMVKDGRSWSTMLYMLLQMPLGIAYFTFVVAGISVSLALLFSPFAKLLGASVFWWDGVEAGWLVLGAMSVVGFVGLLVTLHVSRAVGRMHGALAKYLLVRI